MVNFRRVETDGIVMGTKVPQVGVYWDNTFMPREVIIPDVTGDGTPDYLTVVNNYKLREQEDSDGARPIRGCDSTLVLRAGNFSSQKGGTTALMSTTDTHILAQHSSSDTWYYDLHRYKEGGYGSHGPVIQDLMIGDFNMDGRMDIAFRQFVGDDRKIESKMGDNSWQRAWRTVILFNENPYPASYSASMCMCRP